MLLTEQVYVYYYLFFNIFTYCLIITIPATFNGAAPAPVVWYSMLVNNPPTPAAASSSNDGKPPGNLTLSWLILPIVISLLAPAAEGSALKPIIVLLLPVNKVWAPEAPNTKFSLPVVIATPAWYPNSTLSSPFVIEAPAAYPTAVLNVAPDCATVKANEPIAMFLEEPPCTSKAL